MLLHIIAKCGNFVGTISENIMASVSFRIKGTKSNVPIYIRFRPNRTKEIHAKTKYLIDKDKWDHANGQPKKSRDISIEKITADLLNLKKNILEAYLKESGSDLINKEWLETLLGAKPEVEIAKSGPPLNIVEYFDFYIAQRGHQMAMRSIQKYVGVKKYITEFENHRRAKFKIKDVGFSFCEDYCRFLTSKGYAQNTANRSVKFLKTVCFHARSGGMSIDNTIERYKIKESKITWPFLSFTEIEKIHNFNFDKAHLKNASEWLVIACCTAQRVSDLFSYSKENIVNRTVDNMNVPFLAVVQQKTGKPIEIPLFKQVVEILERHNGDFPRKISSQKFNLYIKEVCKACEIDEIMKGSKHNPKTKKKENGKFPKYELVTSHIGRRSFATNFYGHSTISPQLIMEITGHSTQQKLMTYIGKKDISLSVNFASEALKGGFI